MTYPGWHDCACGCGQSFYGFAGECWSPECYDRVTERESSEKET